MGVKEEEVSSKKRELEVLVEEELRLDSTIQASQAEIQALIRTLADIEFLLGETRCVTYPEPYLPCVAVKRFKIPVTSCVLLFPLRL
jgi:hypothetical protein